MDVYVNHCSDEGCFLDVLAEIHYCPGKYIEK